MTLDTTFPLYRPLRRLLLRLEEAYPLPPFHRRYDKPKRPPRKAWYGDRHVLFGGVLPTTTIVSIGVLGWTSEVLVCKMEEDRYRENVRTAITRLEDEKLLQASRPRGPGFNVRQLTISDSFPAKRELRALVRAYVRVWPDTERIVRDCLLALPPRAQEHLRRRGSGPMTSRSLDGVGSQHNGCAGFVVPNRCARHRFGGGTVGGGHTRRRRCRAS